MIIIILSLTLFLIFTTLGSIHFYWFLGGTWGLKKAIPSKGYNASTLVIPKFAALIVGLILILFGLLYLLKLGFINTSIPILVTQYLYWIIPFLFVIRAIGDFNYVGFFKKIKNTEFAKADSKTHSPLCLIIGIIGIIIQFINE